MYLLHDGDEHVAVFECGYCRSKNLDLIAYASSADQQISILQGQVRELNRRASLLADQNIDEEITDAARERDLIYWN